MTTKIIITPANHGVAKGAASLAGAPRTVRVVTVGAPTAAGRVPLTKTVQVAPSSVSPALVRTVLKRVYSTARTPEVTTATSTAATLTGVLPTPPRKRQRLDHLTADQKNQRRKLKNRVAAQTARDRKKLQMDLLESRVTSLERQNDELLQQNAFLQKQNELLSQQNALLLQRLEPAAAPAAASPSSIESAALISGPRQKGQESGKAAAALLALSLISWAGFQVALAATLTSNLICSTSSAGRFSATKSRREGVRPPPALLWWGPQQKSWSPAMIR